MNSPRHIVAAATILAAAAACGGPGRGVAGTTGLVAADRATTVVTTSVTAPLSARAAPTGIPTAARSVTDPVVAVLAGSAVSAAVDPGTVAVAVTITLATIDTETDTSPADAYRRVALWVDPALLAGILGATPQGDAAWLDLLAHRGYTFVTAQLADEYGQPADTADTAYETVTYTVHTEHRDGTAPPPAATGIRRLQLTATPTGWKVAAFLP